MTAVTIVAGEPTTTSKTEKKVAQVAIADGELIINDTANSNKANLADYDAAATEVVIGLCLNGGAAGQEITYAKPGSIITVTTASFTAGVPYFLGNAGDIVPLADITGKRAVFVGWGLTTTTFLFDPVVPGVAAP